MSEDTVDSVARGKADYAHQRLDKINGQIDGLHGEFRDLRTERAADVAELKEDMSLIREKLAGLAPWIKVGSAAAAGIVAALVGVIIERIVS